MKKTKNRFYCSAVLCAILLLSCNCMPVFSQKKIAVQIGTGLGSTMAKNENAGKKGRVMINLNGYYNLTQQLSLGLELASAGSFINSVGGYANGDKFDPATNTLIKDVSNMKSYAVLAKVKYYFIAGKNNFSPFAEFGLGKGTYYEKVFNVSGISEKKIKKSSLVYQPEIGIAFRHVQLSVRYLGGGRTPVFEGVDEQGTNLKYERIRLSPLYVNLSWRFDF